MTRTAAIHAFLGFLSSGTVPTADSATHGASMSEVEATTLPPSTSPDSSPVYV